MSELPPLYKPRSTLGTLARFWKLWWKDDSFVNSSGLKRSYRENRPVAADGAPLPWFNYALIRLLSDRLRGTERVFEYGSGYSTLYFAQRAKAVVSVEHNADWVAALSPYLPSNARVIETPGGTRYQAAAESYTDDGPFDLVLVDGLDRELCLPYAARALSPTGVIVLDDSHRPAYQTAISELETLGFRSLRWYGPKPNSHIEAQSLLLYRASNTLGI
ncbi:MAG: class I SAM-dependent methyltransferase [Pseudomonadota bacterium]